MLVPPPIRCVCVINAKLPWGNMDVQETALSNIIQRMPRNSDAHDSSGREIKHEGGSTK